MIGTAPMGMEDEPASSSRRDVVAAWIVVILLLVGTGISFALDHMVTVSEHADWAALRTAAGVPEPVDPETEVEGVPVREIRDTDER
jgi:hypothetical protein